MSISIPRSSSFKVSKGGRACFFPTIRSNDPRTLHLTSQQKHLLEMMSPGHSAELFWGLPVVEQISYQLKQEGDCVRHILNSRRDIFLGVWLHNLPKGCAARSRFCSRYFKEIHLAARNLSSERSYIDSVHCNDRCESSWH